MNKSRANRNGRTTALSKSSADEMTRLAAQIATQPAFAASLVIEPFGDSVFSGQDFKIITDELLDIANAIKAGNMALPEAMLVTQALALQSIFVSLSRRSAANIVEHLGPAETYMRLALKAQSLCRSTLTALSEMKNPRQTAFVQQQNIANGPQQVNNVQNVRGAPFPPSEGSSDSAPAGNAENRPDELMEVTHERGEWLDFGTTAAAGGGNTELEALGARKRSGDR